MNVSGCSGGSGLAVSLPIEYSGKRGNPCDASNGNKYLERADFEGGDGVPGFIRYYNSQQTRMSSLGYGWSHNHSMRLEKVSNTLIQVARGSGRTESFTQNTDLSWLGDADSRITLTEDPTTHIFTLTHHDGSKEQYDPQGNLTVVTDSQGLTTTYTYSNNRLKTVTGPYGHVLSFTYLSTGMLSKVTLPSGQYITFTYSSVYNQTSITYPVDGSILPRETYLYENTAFPHHLTGITDENNQRFATYGYDSTGKAILTQHAGGAERFDFVYNGDQTQVTDANGYVENLTFTTIAGGKHLISKLSASDGKALSQDFDTAGRLIRSTNENGVKTEYQYNTTGQLIGKTEAVGKPEQRSTAITYLSNLVDLPTIISKPSVRTGFSKTTTITYNGQKLPESITLSGYKPSGSVVQRSQTLSYDTFGRVVSVDGPRTDIADITTYTYNSCATGIGCGQLASETNSMGQTKTFNSYDGNGRLLQYTEPNGTTVTFTYNGRGQVLSRTETHGTLTRTWQFTYAKTGLLSRSTDPDGVYFDFAYNAAHQPTSITDKLGNAIQFGYDARGNRSVSENKDSSGNLLIHAEALFDHRGRLTLSTIGTSTTSRVWDAVGNLLSETDPKGNTTQWAFDPLGNVNSKTNAAGGQVSESHDVDGQLAGLISPNGTATDFVYDDFGNLLQEQSGDRGTINYQYDAAGNLIQRTDGNGTQVSISYDALNRISGIQFPSSSDNIGYQYDTCRTGSLCQITDASGQTSYQYDGLGRIRQTTLNANNGQSYSTGYTWSLADRVIGMIYPDARTVSFSRNGNGLIQGVSTTINGQAQNIISNRMYRGDGQWISQAFGNNLAQARVFDDQGRLTDDNLGSINQRHNTFDANGNLTSRNESSGITNYTYDALNQLIGEAVNNSHSYGYDDNGNRTALNGVSNQYLIGSNRLIKLGVQSVIADAAGQITALDGYTLEYNGDGRLYRILDTQGAELVRYRYNHSGLRTEKTINGNTTTYLYDLAGQLIGESTGTGLSRSYLYAGDAPIAQITTGDVLTYLHTDHLGTPRIGTNELGNTVWRWSGEAFGMSQPSTNIRTVNLRFPGQYFDSETGFHYNGQRYYDPDIGRYLTSDPIGVAGGINTYAYVENNPIVLTDQTGECPLCVAAWGAYEIGSSIYDIYNAAETVGSDCASNQEKFAAVGGAVLGVIAPGGGYGTAGKQVAKYEVGIFEGLAKRSKGDGLEIHHAAQKHPARQVIPGYIQKNGPSIALPRNEHRRISTIKGEYNGSARDLLAKDIRDLRNNTNTPNSSLQDLIRLNKEMYPNAFFK